MPPSTVRSVLVVCLAVSATVALAGCVADSPEPLPTETEVVETPSAEPTTPPPAQEEPVRTPVQIECDVLVPPSAIDMLFSDFTPDPAYSPAPGSAGEVAVQWQGTACGWVNSEGVRLEVSAAHLPDDELTARGNALFESSNPVPTYGVEGYFRLDGETGEAEVIVPPYWISVVSEHLFEPGDAAPVVEAAVRAVL